MLSLDWQLSFASLGALLVTAAAMKAVSAALKPPAPGRRALFWGSPLFSTDSLERCAPATAAERRALLRSLGGPLLVLAAVYATVGWLGDRLPLWLLPYLALPAIPALGEAAGAFCQLAWSVGGTLLPPHHRQPWRAASLSEFWGRRWNTWLSDWFRQVTFRPLQARPALAALFTFFVSGLWHEVLVDAPLQGLSGKRLFGAMLAYFIVQWLGLAVDRTLPRSLRRPFFFLAAAGPAPLFINEALLRTIHLWPR